MADGKAENLCIAQGCQARRRGQGYCDVHYQRLRRAGEMPVIRPRRSLADRMERFTDRSAGDDGCWGWIGCVTNQGYGQISADGKMRVAHRVAYELANGHIPQGAGYHGTCVCHSCDNPRCVNPAHLFLGSHHDNMMDMKHKDRYTKLHGESHGSAKITEAQAIDILHSGGLHREIAKRHGVSRMLVTAIKNGRLWSYLSAGKEVAA